MSRVKHVLHITGREKSGKGESRRLRHAGNIPAIIYCKGKPGRQITLKSGEWRSLMNHDVQLVHLVENDQDKYLALIKEVQENFLSRTMVHVDFLEVDPNEKIKAPVKVHAHGTAIGESFGGLLEQLLHEIEVEALPANLPENLSIDVSNLNVGDALLVKDIQLPEGVTVAHDLEAIVCNVVLPAAEVAAEEAKPAEVAAEGETPAAEGDAKAAGAKAPAAGGKAPAADAKAPAKKEGKK